MSIMRIGEADTSTLYQKPDLLWISRLLRRCSNGAHAEKLLGLFLRQNGLVG
jgi:hypothetical protein